MAIKTFAAIDVGSYELSMKIFEISPRVGIREIDCISHRIPLGLDSYATEKISKERLDELCEVLKDFKNIMKSYKVDAYKAYGTSAIRETKNTLIILDQIKNRTGITVDVISNSEQRFLDYKAIATKGEEFDHSMVGGCAILDIGGGSIQVSLFEKDTLVATTNLRIGVMRLRERIEDLSPKSGKKEKLIEEIINNQIALFKKLYLKEREIKNLILVDDYFSPVLQNTKLCKEPGHISYEEISELVKNHPNPNPIDMSRSLEISEEQASLFIYSLIVTKRLMEVIGAEHIWAPGITLCDGIAYEYAEKEKIVTTAHDFEKDIIASTQTISKRYMCSKKRNESIEKLAVSIFDTMKKIHGLGDRERLLLQIAAQLNDCGKYISQTEVGECTFRIIMATEIIGLSHMEREMVAYISKYDRDDFEYYEELGVKTTLSRESYMKIAKLTAILRVANGLDRSHKQKFQNVKTYLKENDLVITVDTAEDITLEIGLIKNRMDFFEEVYSVRPIIKQKKSM